ncbi:hypothetical protein HYPSUDRAFT_204278 [Hypholoma sublateritium FD-334 SS-4]|uniref:Uncharacterized protein n=1 Tax=Hypholoma sublateritium (strain FD-334 SS-4) TaxID=945553 RepID=A0A0D2NTF5_HYPSF|nr:hypothetical protein HYPSUDRAFT_204278 [Hypholoma sublateritium FD-334 SS-4]
MRRPQPPCEKTHRCPAPGCAEAYLNPNGLNTTARRGRAPFLAQSDPHAHAHTHATLTYSRVARASNARGGAYKMSVQHAVDRLDEAVRIPVPVRPESKRWCCPTPA